MRDTISVRGARANNLKNVSVELPRDKLVVLTGLSGSGREYGRPPGRPSPSAGGGGRGHGEVKA